MLTPFSYGVASNLSRQNSPKKETIGAYFLVISNLPCGRPFNPLSIAFLLWEKGEISNFWYSKNHILALHFGQLDDPYVGWPILDLNSPYGWTFNSRPSQLHSHYGRRGNFQIFGLTGIRVRTNIGPQFTPWSTFQPPLNCILIMGDGGNFKFLA